MQDSRVSTGIHENAAVPILSHLVQSSMPVKFSDEARGVAKSMDVTLVGSPVNAFQMLRLVLIKLRRA